MALFNNADFVTQSWYLAERSSKVRAGKAVAVDWLGRSIALFRGTGGVVTALDARCPHMGAHLAYGRVEDDTLVCPFHQWAFDSTGKCVDVPYEDSIPSRSHTFSYPTVEKYGFVWIFNGPTPTFSLPSFEDEERLFMFGPIHWTLNCHHHVVISNGIDLNHWRCVHGFEPIDSPEIEKLGEYGIRTHLKLLPSRSRPLFGLFGVKGIEARFSILGGNLAVIHVTSPWQVRILIAHRPLPLGKNLSKMFVFFPRKGPFSRILGIQHVTALTKVILMAVLLHDDREILNNIEFWPRLTKQDQLLAAFIQQVNGMKVFDPRNGEPRNGELRHTSQPPTITGLS